MTLAPAIRRRLLRAALVAAVACAALAPAATAQPSTPIGHVGRWITDAQGRTLLLHGLNMTDKIPPYRLSGIGFGPADAVFLRNMGMTTIRLGLIWKALEPQPGHYDNAYLADYIRTVRQLEAQGIYVLVDFHQDQYNEKYNGEGFPDWADIDDGQPTTPNLGFPRNYTNMPALNAAFDSFWSNRAGPDGVGLQDRFALAWRYVAKALRREPRILGFDILNEPWPGSQFSSCQQASGCPDFDAKLTAFTKRVVAYIRSVDRRRLVFYEPILSFSTTGDPHIGAIGDSNAVFGFHDYCLVGGVTTVRCAPNDRRVFSKSEQLSQRTGDGLFLTEFGATQSADDMARVENVADANLVGWQNWSYWNIDTCCRRPGEGLIREVHQLPTAANIKPLKLRTLARPYPETIAGTPLSVHWDQPSRVLTASWTTTSVAGQPFRTGSVSEVQVSPVNYPLGYRVRVTGARVISKANAPVLLLSSLRGAKQIALTIRPVLPKGAKPTPSGGGGTGGSGGTGGGTTPSGGTTPTGGSSPSGKAHRRG